MSKHTTVLRNPVDTWVGSGQPSRNWADSKRLRLDNAAGDTCYAYVFFNRPFPLGATIHSATLRVFTRGVWNTSPTLTVHRVSERWPVNRTTWNNRPAVGTITATRTKSSGKDDDEWDIDVTEHLQRVSNGGVWFGFRLSTNGARVHLHSGNTSTGTRPSLEVVWSDAPQAPTDLSPAGSLAVAVAKPHLTFDFTDLRGSTALQAVQVQVSPTGDWATAWDSGAVLSDEPELDLALTTYPGVLAGEETRWRVRVQDAAGLWSPWSDAARFRRDIKGGLTILNPAAPPNDFVSEWTPPIIWELTGEVQRAWQVIIAAADDTSDHLYDTGKTRGADTSWTLPRGVLEDDTDYHLIVRVWDSKDRVRTGNDRVWTQASRTFRFNEDPTTNPVTNLAGENLLPRPWMALTWQRDTAPDGFTIKRNGKVVETGLDPADLLTSGTSYRWVDKDARPHAQHTWTVQATANGKTSANNPTLTADLTQQGIWLTDPDRDLDVFINGDDEGTWAMGEEATTHHPLGAHAGVRITQSLRGYEGSITGILTSAFGIGVEVWENRLLSMKARPGNVLRLSLGNEAMRVVVGNVVTAPTPDLPLTRAVSFDFWQVPPLSYRPRL